MAAKEKSDCEHSGSIEVSPDPVNISLPADQRSRYRWVVCTECGSRVGLIEYPQVNAKEITDTISSMGLRLKAIEDGLDSSP